MDSCAPRLARLVLLCCAVVALIGCDDDDPQPVDEDTSLIGDSSISDTDIADDALEATDTGPEDTSPDAPNDTAPDTAMPACVNDDDCQDAAASRCDQDTGQCVGCLTHDDCFFDKPICTSLQQCGECETDPQCAEARPGTTCVGAVGICQQCLGDADCAAPTPICSSQRQCGECRTAFDCSNRLAPTCVDSPVTGAGECLVIDLCDGDDANEAVSDDGPAGATDLTPMDGTETRVIDTSVLCNEPAVENDWFKVEVVDGDNLTIAVDWSDPDVDIDVSVFDAEGLVLGESWYVQPEVVELTNLPAGTVYVALVRFDGEEPLLASYTITATRTAGGCTTDDDCLAPHDTQLLRGQCDTDTGACQRIRGDGMLANGERCDSPGDCASDHCGYGEVRVVQVGFDTNWYTSTYMADVGTRAVCTPTCTDDTDCATGEVCTTVFGEGDNHCVPACTSDEMCPVDLFALPSVDGDTWHHLSCVDGHCQTAP